MLSRGDVRVQGDISGASEVRRRTSAIDWFLGRCQGNFKAAQEDSYFIGTCHVALSTIFRFNAINLSGTTLLCRCATRTTARPLMRLKSPDVYHLIIVVLHITRWLCSFVEKHPWEGHLIHIDRVVHQRRLECTTAWQPQSQGISEARSELGPNHFGHLSSQLKTLRLSHRKCVVTARNHNQFPKKTPRTLPPPKRTADTNRKSSPGNGALSTKGSGTGQPQVWPLQRYISQGFANLHPAPTQS